MSDYYNPAAQQQLMPPVEAVKTCLRKYVDFSGRASRAEFWWFFLFCILVTWVLDIFKPYTAEDLNILMQASDPSEVFTVFTNHSLYFSFYFLVQLLLLLPSLAVQSRRLHDIGCSAWWMLLYFTCIGWIALIIMAILPSQKYPNKYGSVPCMPESSDMPDDYNDPNMPPRYKY